MIDYSRNTPGIDATGTWSVAPPFDRLLDVTAEYRCNAIRTFGELRDMGIDVLKDIYIAAHDRTPEGILLAQTAYARDLETKAAVVYLTSPTQRSFSVPDTYILTLPGDEGLRYNHVSITADIGLVTDTYNLEPLIIAVRKTIAKELGIEYSETRAWLGLSPTSGEITEETRSRLVSLTGGGLVRNDIVVVNEAEAMRKALTQRDLELSILRDNTPTPASVIEIEPGSI